MLTLAFDERTLLVDVESLNELKDDKLTARTFPLDVYSFTLNCIPGLRGCGCQSGICAEPNAAGPIDDPFNKMHCLAETLEEANLCVDPLFFGDGQKIVFRGQVIDAPVASDDECRSHRQCASCVVANSCGWCEDPIFGSVSCQKTSTTLKCVSTCGAPTPETPSVGNTMASATDVDISNSNVVQSRQQSPLPSSTATSVSGAGTTLFFAPSESANSSTLPFVVGIVVGLLFLVFISAVACFLVLRRRRERRNFNSGSQNVSEIDLSQSRSSYSKPPAPNEIYEHPTQSTNYERAPAPSNTKYIYSTS